MEEQVHARLDNKRFSNIQRQFIMENKLVEVTFIFFKNTSAVIYRTTLVFIGLD